MTGPPHPDSSEWLRPTNGGCTLALRVQPRAKHTEIRGVRNGRLLVRLKAPPTDGKANDELVGFLRKSFGLPKSAIQLIAGETSRDKVVFVHGVGADKASTHLSMHPESSS
ncbi:MAG: DUF167 domain-containing protein [Verrucomicrobiota bacterium]